MKILGLVITTAKQYGEDMADMAQRIYNVDKRCAWSAINPVIHDLEKLRANTWDQDKITHIQNWLRNNFEVKQ